MRVLSRPPLLARALVHVCLRGDAREVIRGDLDQEFADTIGAGGRRRDARRRYWRQALASIGAVHQPSGDVMTWQTMSRFWRGLSLDARAVARALRASPGYALVAVLSLAIGIGANTVIAGVARAALFAPMPVERPDELSFVFWSRLDTLNGMYMDGDTDPRTGERINSNVTFPAYLALCRQLGDAMGAFAFIPRANVVVGGRPAESAGGVLVDGNFFGVLKPPMALGRGLTTDDDRPGAAPVAVIGYDFWQRAAAGSPSVLDVPIVVNGVPARIVGVTADGFRGLSPGGFRPATDISMPLSLQPALIASWTPAHGSLFTDPSIQWTRAITRVPAGTSPDTVETMATAVLRAHAVEIGAVDAADAATVHATLRPAARGVDINGPATRTSVTILAAVVGVVLLITCLNVAGLTLARGAARQREWSILAALGASRWRLIRMALFESAALAAGGAGLGVALIYMGRPLLAAMIEGGLGPTTGRLTVDVSLLAVTLGVSAAAAIAAGLVPALQRSGRRMTSGLSQRPGGSTAPRQVVGRVLLAAQIAVTFPLLAGAGLLLRTMHNLTRVDVGFEPATLLVFRVDAPSGPDGAAPIGDYERMLRRVRELPGVRTASMSENPLLSGLSSTRSVLIDGRKTSVYTNAVASNFFDALGVPLIAGRALDDRDAAGPERVVINATAADRFFGGAALGRRFVIPGPPGTPPRDVEVVGVSADTKYTSVRAATPPTIFDHYARHQSLGLSGVSFVVRADRAPGALERPIREAVAAVTPNIAVTAFRTEAEQIGRTLGRERIFARLLAVFGGFALLLACVGLHGVTSYAVARRTNEIGVRVALGARRGQVLWLILRQVIVLAAVGLAAGVPAAVAAGPLLKSLLFGLAATDPWTLAGAALAMTGVTVLAGWVPARRAAALDPLRAIRRD